MIGEHTEREDTTLTNIIALREDLVGLHKARSSDGARRHKLTVLILSLVSCLLAASVLMVSQMMLGVNAIQEDQQVVHEDIAKVLVVTTKIAQSRADADTQEAVDNRMDESVHPFAPVPPTPEPTP